MKDTAALMADFFAQDDLARLTADAGELLDCPLMVIDDAFRVTAHYAPPGFTDPLFDRAVQQGAITYEAGAIISRSPALSAGAPDYVEVADSTRRRRFAPLISVGVRLGYLVCVDIDGHLADIPAETFRTVETVLAKQLFVEASRQDKPFGTAELLARIRIALRHVSNGTPDTPTGKAQNGRLTIDYDKRRIYLDDQEVHLTQVEYKIVMLTMLHIGKVLTYDFIIRCVWGARPTVNNQILRVNMANIRRKLEANPADPQFIITETGVGYRMIDHAEENV